MLEMPKLVTKIRLKRKSYKDIKRYKPDVATGLSNRQVNNRILQNKINKNANPKTKSIGAIIRHNLFTLFNLVNIILASALIYVGSYKNMLFMGIVITNFCIDIVQELRAKRATDRLSLMAAATVTVRRNKKELTLRSEEVVLDDILLYSPGKQVVTDSIVLEGECEVNESFLTGESEPVLKSKGDMLYSGSFISSGSCIAQADAVGTDNASYEITAGAKKLKNRASEIVKSLRKIIRIISVVIIPLGMLFFVRQYTLPENTYVQATENTVAALIGMIPEGLILLTSTVLAVIVIKLAKRKVLVNALYSVEMLARTDVICLDKTGTLTEGSMRVEDIIILNPDKKQEAETILASMHAALDSNHTLSAIGKHFDGLVILKAENIIPFSSKKKWCGAYFTDKGAYILGAPDVVLGENESDILSHANLLATEYRVLCLSSSATVSSDGELPKERKAVCLILLSDTIRPNAKETVEYFINQGVAVKIISGDNPITVSHVAKSVGIDGWDKAVDMSSVTDDGEIEKIADKYVVFGRTNPLQKQLLIKALRANGHTVAMTGDGVNDVLAMKEADCSIAIAEGTDAARTVADIVLLDSSFEAVPRIVEEGRTAINNIQRTASLFLVKTIYSTLLTLIFLFMITPYPFKPIQLTLISCVSIGVPAFFLAFQSNKERVKGGFLQNVMLKAAPTGITIVIGVLAVHILSRKLGLTHDEVVMISVLLTGIIALLGVLFISLPLDRLRLTLVVAMSGIFAVSILVFRDWFEITFLCLRANIALIVISACCGLIFWVLKLMLVKLILKPYKV